MNTKHPLGRSVEVRSGGITGIIGSFGMTRVRPNGKRKMHKGIDYLCEVMDPVYAAHDGTISRDGFERDRGGKEHNDGYGRRIALVGPDGLETRYAHLTLEVYKRTMRVRRGDLIGFAGRTGNVGPNTPTHLHFEVRIDGEPVNPDWWLTGEGQRDGISEHSTEV